MNDTYTKERIEIGDTVWVNFNGAQFTLCRRATVLFMPSGPGDSWGFFDEDTGQTHYVSEGCTISKHIPANTR